MHRAQIVHSDAEISAANRCLWEHECQCEPSSSHLEGGETLDEFLDNFPTVTREQTIAFLEESATTLLAAIV